MRFQPISHDEAETLFKRKERKTGVSEYKLKQMEVESYLRSLAIGDGGIIFVEENERKLTIKNRLRRAAVRLGVEIRFKPSQEDRIIFRVVRRTL